MKENTWVHHFTKTLVDVLFYVGVVCPFALLFLGDFIGLGRGYYYPQFEPVELLIAVLFVSGLAGLYMLWQLKTMFRTLTLGDPYVRRNVVAFRRMSVACFVITLLFLGRCVYAFTIAGLIIAGGFCLGGLFCLTLKDLFKRAVLYKEENELTI